VQHNKIFLCPPRADRSSELFTVRKQFWDTFHSKSFWLQCSLILHGICWPVEVFFVKAVFFAYLRLPRCITSISKHNPIWYYSQVVNNAKSEYLTEFFLSDLILHVYVICGPQKFVIIQFTEYVKHKREKLS